MSCRDMMLWIGTSYYKIDCGCEEVTSEACAYGPRGKVKRCYVHEAEYRGCCRRIPNLIPWAVPGETRVFLVHSVGCEEGHQGTLFGYYLLERFETVVDPATYDRLDDPDYIPWSPDLFKEIHQKVREDYSSKPLQRDELGRRSTTTSVFGRGFPTEKSEVITEQVLRHIEDTTNDQFERWRQQFPRHVAQKQMGYRKPRYSSQEDILQELLGKLLEDVLGQVLERVIEKKAQDFRTDVTSEPDSELRVLNPYHTAGEWKRACSPPNTAGFPPLRHKRTKPGAVYAVDLLTAQITDQYIDLLKEKLEDPTGIGKEDRALKEGIFKEAVGQVHKRRAQGQCATRDAMKGLPSTLRKEMVKRGELVLFPHPFPVIQRCPKASFRGHLRLDGDQLVEGVERTLGERQRLVRIPYCVGLEGDGPITRAQLQAYLARELLVNQSMAGRFLEILTKRIAEDIAQYGRFVLPGFGSFSLEADGKVGFYAYEPLRDKLNELAKPLPN